MNNYDPQDLKSVLEYIYDSYGLSVFLKNGKLQAYFSDLAPRLTKELHMIKLLDENGILEKMSRVEVNDVVQQKKILNILKAKLTGDIPIDPAYVISFLQILSEVLGWRYLSFQDDCQKELIHHQPENPIEKSQSPKNNLPPVHKSLPSNRYKKSTSHRKILPCFLLLFIAVVGLGIFYVATNNYQTEPSQDSSVAITPPPKADSLTASAAVPLSPTVEETQDSDTNRSSSSEQTTNQPVPIIDINESYQNILVEASGSSAQLTLRTYRNGEWIEDFYTAAAIGSNGVTDHKTEGDHMTPIGTFPLRFVFSTSKQDTKMPFVEINQNSVWVCDPDSSFYNTLQSTTNPARDWSNQKGSVEKMYVKFSKKSSTACIYFEFNGDGRTQYSADHPNGGSALFLDGVGTNGNMYSGYGDIKISASAMKELLRLLDPELNPTITIQAA